MLSALTEVPGHDVYLACRADILQVSPFKLVTFSALLSLA